MKIILGFVSFMFIHVFMYTLLLNFVISNSEQWTYSSSSLKMICVMVQVLAIFPFLRTCPLTRTYLASTRIGSCLHSLVQVIRFYHHGLSLFSFQYQRWNMSNGVYSILVFKSPSFDCCRGQQFKKLSYWSLSARWNLYSS
jgi:hypothetical protein